MGYAVGAFALLVLLSTLNGFENTIFKVYKNYYPDLKVSPKLGKYIELDAAWLQNLRKTPGVAYASAVIEDNAIVKYGEKQMVAQIKGVDSSYRWVINADSVLQDGSTDLYLNQSYLAWMGSGVYYQLMPQTRYASITVMTPRTEDFSVARLDMNELPVYVGSVIDPGEELTNKLIITPLAYAEELFEKYDLCTGIELRVKNGQKIENVKKQIQKKLGNTFVVKTRQEQNQAVYKMYKSEKLIVFLIMCFVLLLVSFNLLGALSMLVIEKKQNIKLLDAVGMPLSSLKRIFFNQGLMIAITGTLVGLVLAIGVVIIQQQYGLLKVDSEFTQAYPVDLRWIDVLIVLGLGLIMGIIAAIYPTNYIGNTNKEKIIK